ncbi:hypothetical protein LZ32DRAFT_619202 [Colletotrichum eremochloae]|nr:hypothetical protein LZ32DRAFT_619202 [Colletotrichum eremochloae]
MWRYRRLLTAVIKELIKLRIGTTRRDNKFSSLNLFLIEALYKYNLSKSYRLEAYLSYSIIIYIEFSLLRENLILTLRYLSLGLSNFKILLLTNIFSNSIKKEIYKKIVSLKIARVEGTKDIRRGEYSRCSLAKDYNKLSKTILIIKSYTLATFNKLLYLFILGYNKEKAYIREDIKKLALVEINNIPIKYSYKDLIKAKKYTKFIIKKVRFFKLSYILDKSLVIFTTFYITLLLGVILSSTLVRYYRLKGKEYYFKG